MNILIVNAYKSSSNNKKKFTSFCNIIKNLLKKVSENSGIDNFYFIYRTPNTINDFLYNYESNSGEESKDNLMIKKNFDKIDMVFIDGNEKYLPWEDKGYRLLEFIRLCKAANKILFAAGVALEILIYYLATGSNNIINFINSKGQIQAIEEIDKIPINFLNNLKKNDYFLDFVTGDILEYHIMNKIWIPIMNIGLHKQIAAEKYLSRGKFILPDNFKGKEFIKKNNTIISNCHEILNVVTRQYLSHYLVESLPNEFTAYTSLTWFPHFFNVFYKKYHFKAICQSDRGISVIEHENSVGVAFHPQANYRETVVLLENFIRYKLRDVQIKLFKFQDKTRQISKKDEIPLMFRNYKYNDEEKRRSYLSKKFMSLNNNKMNFIGNVNNSIAFNRIKKVKNVASHVGMGFNNRDMIFVENNAIIQNPLSLNYTNNLKNKFKENSKYDFFSLKRNENTRISEIFKPINSSLSPLKTISYNDEQEKYLNMKNLDMLKKEIEKGAENGLEYLTFIKREKMDEDQLIAYYKKTRRHVCQKLEEINNLSKFKSNSHKKMKFRNYKTNKSKNKSNIRLKTSFSFNNKINNYNDILNKNKDNKEYRTIDYEKNRNFLTEKNNLDEMEAQYRSLMGTYSSRPVKTAILSKNKLLKYSKNFSVDNKLKINQNQNDKWKKYENFSPEEIKRKEFLESKKKWMSKEDFHRVFGVRSTSIKPIPSVMIYGKPVSSHKYRDIYPEKWITPNGFI